MRSGTRLLAITLIGGMFAAAQGAPIVLDLSTSAGLFGFTGGAFFRQYTLTSSTGSGVINSFLKLQTNNPAESGYNTTGTLEFNTSKGDPLPLSAVPRVQIQYSNGVSLGYYREFFLDTNENVNLLLTIANIQVFMHSTSNQTGYSTSAIGLAQKVWDMQTGAAVGSPREVLLSDDFGKGSGKGDYLIYVPDSAFLGYTGNDYVYFYGSFTQNDGGFEELYVGKNAVPVGGDPVIIPVPEPGTALLGAGAAGALLVLLRRRSA